MKILVADDSRVMRQIVKRTLRRAGFTGHEVIEAGEGTEALELALTAGPGLGRLEYARPQRARGALRAALERAWRHRSGSSPPRSPTSCVSGRSPPAQHS